MSNVLCGNDAKIKILTAVKNINNAVKLTIGPCGKNAIIFKGITPVITNDGVSIVKKVISNDEYENMVLNIITEVAIKTNDEVGDGTTSSIIIACNLIENCFQLINNGINSQIVKEGLQIGLQQVLNKIELKTKHIKIGNDLKSIASISSGDDFLGKLIFKAISKTGKNGIIYVEESKTTETTLEFIDGFCYERGFISSYLVNDNMKNKIVLMNPYILLTTKSIERIDEIIKVLEFVSSQGRSLLIICIDINSDVLNTIILNKIKRNLQIGIIKLPNYNENQRQILSDISIYTNTKIIDNFENNIDEISIEKLGSAKKVIVTNSQTTIISGNYNEESYLKRVNELTNIINNCKEKIVKERFEKRLANLTSSVAIIKVGGSTDVELSERKDKLDDAINATKFALLEGIVPGGGICLYDVMQELKNNKISSNNELQKSYEALLESLKSPFKQIISNSGTDVDKVLKLLEEKSDDIGFNAKTKTIVNMFDSGIVDPAKVVKTSLINAVSVASLLITSDVIIVQPKEKKELYDDVF